MTYAKSLSLSVKAREEGREEALSLSRAKLQRVRDCVEGYKASFNAAVSFWQTKQVAESLHILLDGGHVVTKELVAYYEAESEKLKGEAEALQAIELDLSGFSL